MSSNGVHGAEDADMAECDGEKVVTMMDVLEEQQNYEDDANAVLGASDEKNCTYSKGYIKRQAIYACLTCCSDAKVDPTKRAGVCLACSINCHENHELVELYTKRNFRCDCGNSKFNSNPCVYTPNKTELNNDNTYNQNFSGLYCNCHRPYPDPESTVEEEMIQCIICEDWLHASHLDAVVPSIEQYSEMVCKDCMDKNEFLHDYSNLTVNVVSEDVDVTNGDDAKLIPGYKKPENSVNNTAENTTENNQDAMNVDDPQTDKSATEMETTTINTQEEKSDEDKTVTESTDDTTEIDKSVKATEEPEDQNANKTPSNESMEILQEETGDNLQTEINASVETPSENEETKDITEATEISNLEGSAPISEPTQTETEENTKTMNENEIQANTEMSKEPTEDKPTENASVDQKLDAIAEETTENKTEPLNSRTDDNKPRSSENVTNDVEMNDKEQRIENEPSCDTNIAKIEDNSKKVDSNEIVKDTNNSETIEVANNENKRKLSTDDATDNVLVKKTKLDDENKCIRPKGVKRLHKGATFWPSNFREKLCSCSECVSMYKDLSVLYLIDVEDTISAYIKLGKERVDGRGTQYEIGLKALSSLGRTQQIDALTEYNKMKDELLDFLKGFKDKKQIVKEEDIKAFFAKMKPKREPDGVYFCR